MQKIEGIGFFLILTRKTLIDEQFVDLDEVKCLSCLVPTAWKKKCIDDVFVGLDQSISMD